MIYESCKEFAVPWKEVNLGLWEFMPLQGKQTLWKQKKASIRAQIDVADFKVIEWKPLF